MENKKSYSKRFFDAFKKNNNTASPTAPKQGYKRTFNAAKVNRFNVFETRMNGTDVNTDTFFQGGTLLKLVREMAKNNAHVSRVLNIMVHSIVGSAGFSLYVNGYDIKKEVDTDGKVKYVEVFDQYNSKAILDSFWDWAKRKNCDVSQRFSLNEIKNLTVRQLFRDGEVLILKQKGGKEINQWGFGLQMIDIARLDRTYNGENSKNGNRIIMSVEVDSNDRKVAFYIKRILDNTGLPTVNKNNFKNEEYTRIEARNCIYLYRAVEAEQYRGFSPLLAGLESLEQLDGYTEAELINARAKAGNTGFFISNDETVKRADLGAVEVQGEDDEGTGEFIQEVEPGTFHVLPKGYDYRETAATYPETFDMFTKVILRRVASAWNISYETLANDRESVNFSSIRAGKEEDRDFYKSVQNYLIETMLDDIYEDWLKYAILNKTIILADGKPLAFEQMEKFKKHLWRGRGFPYIEPSKDAATSVVLINAGLSSRRRECEKLGFDFQEVFDELAQEKKIADSMGLNLDNTENVLQSLADINTAEAASNANEGNKPKK